MFSFGGIEMEFGFATTHTHTPTHTPTHTLFFSDKNLDG